MDDALGDFDGVLVGVISTRNPGRGLQLKGRKRVRRRQNSQRKNGSRVVVDTRT